MEALIIMSIVFLWIVVLFNLILTLGIARRINNKSTTGTDPNAEDRLQPGTPAPMFTAKTLDGQEVTLETYAGKPVAFLFVTTNCDPCREAIPDLVEIAPMALHAGVQFVFVFIEEAKNVRGFAEEQHITSPILIAPPPNKDTPHGHPFPIAYKATATPSYCLVEANGLVRASGHPRMGQWRDLEMTWKKQYPKVIETVPVERR